MVVPGDKRFIADMIFDCENKAIAEDLEAPMIVDPIDFTRRKSIPAGSCYLKIYLCPSLERES
jgi:hypothetical protein